VVEIVPTLMCHLVVLIILVRQRNMLRPVVIQTKEEVVRFVLTRPPKTVRMNGTLLQMNKFAVNEETIIHGFLNNISIIPLDDLSV